MANERLGAKNVELLLDHYRAERRRLLFQLDHVRETIAKLNAIKEWEVKTPADDHGPKRPGRPRLHLGEASEKRGPGRPRKEPKAAPATRRRKRRKKAAGYRLSPWDEMVIATIGKEGLLPKEVIVERARAWAKTHARKMTVTAVEAKITNVLQKLTGTRGLLGTHRTGLRRGYHYGLKDWFFKSSGALRRQHLDKLVIEPEQNQTTGNR